MLTDIRAVGFPSMFEPLQRVEHRIEHGKSLAEIVELLLPGALAEEATGIEVSISGDRVAPGFWHVVRPKPGATVVAVAGPANDGLRTFLQVAVIVAAVAAGQFYAGTAFAASLGSLGSALSTAAVSSTVLFAGNALIDAIVPPQKDGKNNPVYAVSGLRNNLTPNGAIPLILGKVRYYPPFAVKPFSTAIGDDRWLTAAFLGGIGPLAWSQPRIGKTPLDRFPGITFEARQGYAGDARLALVPETVIEEAQQIQLKGAQAIFSGPQIRATAADISRYEVDIVFPGGLFSTNDDGEFEPWSVAFTHRRQVVGTGTWTSLPDIVVTSDKRQSITRTIPVVLPERGRDEIELNRVTVEWDDADQSKRDTKHSGRSFWAAVRSIRPEYPINPPVPCCLFALKIQGSAVVNGQLDGFNVLLSSLIPDWDAPTQSWIVRETNRPASLFRYVLTGPAIAYPLSTSQIAALGEWHDFCVLHDLQYNRVHDDPSASIYDVLQAIAAVGRASARNGGTSWGVVIDRALSYVAAHVSPRNSWGFEGSRRYTKKPHAFRVPFLDETNDYEPAERIVPWPGFAGSPTIIEQFELPGITNPDLIWKETRRRQYELERRPDTFVVNQDFESLGTERGDRVDLNHDVLDTMQKAARVIASGDRFVTLDDLMTMEEGQTYAFTYQQVDGTTITHSVTTVPGETAILAVTSAGPMPQVDERTGQGPLVFFGPSSRVSLACTVKDIEAMNEFTARLTLIPHAPEIEAYVDAEIPPPWSGRAGAVAQEPTGPPLAPIITSVVSGRLAQGVATEANPYPVAVLLQADPADVILLAAFEVRHRLQGAGAWSASVSAAVAAGSVSLAGYARADAIEVQARAVSLQGTPSLWSATVTHVVAATDPPPPAMPIYLSATQSAPHVVDHLFRAPDDASVRHLQLVCARGYGAPIAQASIVAQIASGQNQAGSYTGSVGLGLSRFWLRALNSAAIASDPAPSAGPREILAPRQLGSLLTAPDDMTNAAWVKPNATPTLSGTGPDGVTMSLLREVVTAGNVSHRVGQAVTFPAGTSGLRICYAQGVAAAGRTRGALYVFDAAGSSSARVTFNLATGTVGAVSYTGSTVTSAIAEITRVSADLYLVTLTATVAAGGADVRLYTANDANSTSYIGDSSKGLYAWAASVAPAA